MLKKLRQKFIALNMGTIAVVLIAAFAAIVIVNWQQSVTQVTATLNTAITRAAQIEEGFGGFPGSDSLNATLNGSESDEQSSSEGESSTSTESSSETNAESEQNDSSDTSAGSTPPEIGGELNRQSFIPVAVYFVQVTGALENVPSVTTASISTDVLEQARTALVDAEDGSGTLNDLGLFYSKKTIEGVTYLAFADVSSASGWQTLALTLTGIGVVVLLIFLAINMQFSKWALRPVEEAWKTQRQFVADASHELKTPLTVILANSSILMDNPNATIASQSQWIEGTQAEAQRMKGLVDDMLELARLDAQTPQPKERTDLAKLTESSLLQFESLAYERGVTLDSDVSADIWVMGNTGRLSQLLGTLLDNASKYAGVGGRVFVTLHREGTSACLTVNNNGDPIPAEELPHVFDRFWRADKARDRAESSYGLGLAIAQGIATEHNGTIAVTSSLAAGTTFTVKIPLA